MKAAAVVAVAALTDTVYLKKIVCPMCPNTCLAAYGPISVSVGCCSKKCSEEWDNLPFDEKQRRLDTIHGVKPHIVAQTA